MSNVTLLRRVWRGIRVVLLATIVGGLLASCGKGSSADPPTSVTLVPGDGQFTVSWVGDPSADWWVFYGPNPAMTLDNWTDVAGSRALQSITSPRVVSGLTNGTQYTVILNGRISGGKGGSGSVPAFVTPRAAGETWSTGTPLSSGRINSVVRGTTLFVAVGSGGTLFTSPDAITWSTANSNTTEDLLAVGFSNARYTAVGTNGVVVTSSDGITWTLQGRPTTGALRGITAYGGGFLIVGDAGFLARGDGVNWLVLGTGTTQQLNSVVSINSTQFLAVGVAGTARYSTNLSDWIAVNTGITGDLTSVAYSPITTTNLASRVVVVGSNGAMSTSLDGQSWSTLTPITTSDLKSLVFGSRFVAVGATGAVVRSDDGLTWTTSTSGTTADLNGVAFGVGNYVAGATGGLVFRSQ